MRSRKLSSFALALMLSVSAASAMADVMVGGAPMLPSKDIIDNAVNSKDHRLQAWSTRSAPTNAAFAALPAGTVDTLLKPENKAALTKVLTYQVVAGNSVMVTDESGNTATVTIADVYQSNGVIHVVDKVLLPK